MSIHICRLNFGQNFFEKGRRLADRNRCEFKLGPVSVTGTCLPIRRSPDQTNPGRDHAPKSTANAKRGQFPICPGEYAATGSDATGQGHRQRQFPFAAIVGCIDFRASNELIFDQGIGSPTVDSNYPFSCTRAGRNLKPINCAVVLIAYIGVFFY